MTATDARTDPARRTYTEDRAISTMRRARRRAALTLGVVLAIAAVASPARAAGLLTPKGSGLPPLEIRDHKVSVVINNGFAVTEVDQVFHNPHDRDLDAVYTFPLPKDAALSELSLWIDGEEIVGEVVEKEQGRAILQEEKQAGRDAALAEQRDYQAFDVFVTPVRAGSDTRVRLVYLQPLEIDSGVGRYVYPMEEGNVDGAKQFWDKVEAVQGAFAFDCAIHTAYPLDGVRVTGYEDKAVVAKASADTWTATLKSESGVGIALDHDVIVYYRLAENLPARVDLLAYRDPKSAADKGNSGAAPGTFLVVITPGADLAPIKEGVDWSVVLDVSGSMEDKIRQASEAVRHAISTMRPQDRFRIALFSQSAHYLDGAGAFVPVTPENVARVTEELGELHAESGTNLHAGLDLGLKGLDKERTSAVILISDGGANVGPTEHSAFLALLKDTDVRVFTFVMGQGANVPLMERLAEASGGFTMDVSNQDDLYGRLLQVKGKLAREALHGVRVELAGARTEDLAPQQLSSAYWGQQIVLFGRYDTPGPAVLTLRARISGEEKEWRTRIDLPASDRTYPELERLWALARTRDLRRQIRDGAAESELRAPIVDLGKTYSIVTDYTSMIVVRKERFADLGIERKNDGRVAEERAARGQRASSPAPATIADPSQPMFQGSPAQGLGGNGGGGGAGAFGPEMLAGLAGLLALSSLLRWAERR